MHVFAFKSYRAGLAQLFEQERKLRGSRWSLARLGEKTGIQPSYLTNAIKLRAHLSADQLYMIAENLGLNDDETGFLVLLMEWERASHSKRKRDLQKRIEALRNENVRVPKQLAIPESPLQEADQQRYYLDPNLELLHLFLGINDAPTDTAKIATLWGLPEQTVADALVFLQKTRLVRLQGKKWVAEPVRQLLRRESPLCKPQQMLRRLRAIETLQKIPEDKAYTFSATVTMSEETKLEIQSRFIEFLKHAEQLIRASPSEQIYFLQFDLFPWLNRT